MIEEQKKLTVFEDSIKKYNSDYGVMIKDVKLSDGEDFEKVLDSIKLEEGEE